MELARTAIAGVFADRDSARRACDALDEAGFHQPWMAVTKIDEAEHAAAHRATHDTAMLDRAEGEAEPVHEIAQSSDGPFQALGRFLSGGGNSLLGALEDHGIAPAEAQEIDDTIAPAGAVVVVHAYDRRAEAEAIMQQCGGDIAGIAAGGDIAGIRAGGDNAGIAAGGEPFVNAAPAARTPVATPRGDVADERVLQLREERLEVGKDTVAAGAATIGKRVVTESAALDVPVSHEELFIERRPLATPRADTGAIESGETIRVPLSRDRVNVEKTAVVREEVAIGKRRVEDVQHVSETVRHEELVTETRPTDTLAP